MANGDFQAYLPQSSGYAIILGGGFGFALFMLVLSWLQSKFTEMSPFESESVFLAFFGTILMIMNNSQMRNFQAQVEVSNPASFAQELSAMFLI